MFGVSEHFFSLICSGFDRKHAQDGSHGRALTRNFVALDLWKGYRLEPSPELPDVGTFEAISVFPARVLFWRPGKETSARHRNPLLSPDIGVGLETFGVDLLHTLNLGVYQKLLARAWWALLTNDAFNVLPSMGGRRSVDELVANGIGHLRAACWAYYADFEARNPGVKLNRLQELSLRTLGSREGCSLHTKAAETRPLLRFTAELLLAKQACIPQEDAALLPAAQALADFSDALREFPRAVTVAAQDRLVNLFKRYVGLAEMAKVPDIPKLHLAMHMVHRTGPPKNKRCFFSGRDGQGNFEFRDGRFLRVLLLGWCRLPVEVPDL